MAEDGSVFAVGLAALSACLLIWRALRFPGERERFRQLQERHPVALGRPRFMGYPAQLVAALIPPLVALIPMAIGLVWIIFCFFGVAIPLVRSYGEFWGISCGLLVAITGFVLGIEALVIHAERKKRLHRLAEELLAEKIGKR
ncbi:MAG: hypothetical protein ING26_09285 [Roseomonas sp.]|nr:hypothetical protein [Roseomonas sp.]MCA3298544.1 hypothetical protein [Roseomonas sp.]